MLFSVNIFMNSIRRRNITSEYNAYLNMLYRCYNIKNHAYHSYGGRGITVCQDWIDSFENFIRDMGPKPIPLTSARADEYSLDRIDNNIGYHPANCRWATRLEQCRNRRHGISFTIDGITRSLGQWALLYGKQGSGLMVLVRRGVPFEDALTAPRIQRGRPSNIWRAANGGHLYQSAAYRALLDPS